MFVSNEIVLWYKKNKRDLPWRHTKNSYIIWISEILLQQTRVKQAIGYFNRFVAQFPDVQKLADAKEEEVLKYWQGLGYYSRARNLHYSARYIVNELGGIFPQQYNDIIKLKGVGEYTAAAIASFAFDEKVSAIDGNVYRVLSRIFNISLAVNSGKGKKVFREIAETLIENQQPGEFNQAMIEFGALLCKPLNPLCSECPVLEVCLAYNNGVILERPVKNKSQVLKKRYFAYLFIKSGERVLIKKRTQKDIWKGLYEFPLIETMSEIKTEELIFSEQWLNIIGKSFELIKVIPPVLHRLSHQLLNVTFYIVKLSEFQKQSFYEDILLSDLETYPVPKVIENFIAELDV
ncbi:MAG: A/G-specific adenine glycosylase [Bacteroidetes bacterium]|nr:MAG: A/G-specific adenine glycosylase [Bacteroidota bacterium]